MDGLHHVASGAARVAQTHLYMPNQETGFFRSWGGSWDTNYGRFFLGWYSSALEKHGDRLLAAAAQIFRPNRPPVAAGSR